LEGRYLEQGIRRTPEHPYGLNPDRNEVEYHGTKVINPRTTGFVKRLNRAVMEEFFRVKVRGEILPLTRPGLAEKTGPAVTVLQLQTALLTWGQKGQR